MTSTWAIIILFTFVAGGDIDRRGKMTCQYYRASDFVECADGSIFEREDVGKDKFSVTSPHKGVRHFDNRGNSWTTDKTGVTRYYQRSTNEKKVRPFGQDGFAFYFEADPSDKSRSYIIDNRGNRWIITGNDMKDPLGRRWRVTIDRFSVITFERILS